MDEDEVLRYLADTLKSVQKASICLVAMVNREGRLDIKASTGVSPELLGKLKNIPASSPALEAIFERGEPLLIEDMAKYPKALSLSLSPDTKSAYVYPIKVEARVLGAVSVSYDVLKPMTSDYHELMTVIASQAGLAVERARLVNNAQRMAAEMSALYDVGLQTGSTLSKDEIIKRTAGNIERLLNPDAYYIALYDAENEMVSFEIFTEHGKKMPKMRASMESGGLTGHIIQTQTPLLIQDWLENGDVYHAIAKKMGGDMLSYLGVPMLCEEHVVGVISVQCVAPMAFDSHDERLLMALAAQTAMALENAKLHQFAQDQAQFDSLTKVYNHGRFVDLVRQAVVDSDGDDSQVALIMIDIDHFKLYNDTYGHVAGDNVLRMVANALKSSVRETDSVGRWGGEEFCVLLTGAGVTEAKKVARLIRRAVSELYPVDGQGHLIPNPTVSQGITSYPFPSATAHNLIEEADAALYHAKGHGRNQLVVYEASNSMKEATVTTGHLARLMQAREALEDLVNEATGPLAPPKTARRITTDSLAGKMPPSENATTPRHH
jgi:diguanylate cyclase (GGDEF)-like protein